MPSCAVITCNNRSENKNVANSGGSYHVFPKEPYVKSKWIDATGRYVWFPSKHSVICSTHFTGEDFKALVLGKLRRLAPNALPRIRLHPMLDLQNTSVVEAETAVAPEDNDPVLCSGVKKEDVTEQCEDSPFVNRCDDCQTFFVSKNNVTAERSNIQDRYRCSECQVGFKNKHRLHIHINSVHSYDIIYSCDYCRKKFTNKEYILMHMKIKHARGSFKCDEREHDQQSTCSKFGEESGESTLPPEVNAVASASSEHQFEVFIKEEPADQELDLGPVVFQHIDSNYRPYKEEPLLD